MNDADVSKQIQQMVRFIRQEAEEKANEISVSAEEVRPIPLRLRIWTVCLYFYVIVFFSWQEFNIEKLQLVEAEKKKIRQEYERKQKQVEVRKKM
jgi:V-type H+-transporting ATPase subunit E